LAKLVKAFTNITATARQRRDCAARHLRTSLKGGQPPGPAANQQPGGCRPRVPAGARATGFSARPWVRAPAAPAPLISARIRHRGNNQVSRHKAGAPGCRVTRSGRGGRPDRGSRLMHSIIVLAVVACVIAVPGIAAALAAFLPGEVAIVTRTAAAFG